MFESIKKLFKKEMNYPIPFAIVKYTDSALNKNIKDDQNKIILYYFRNDFGNIETKKYKYSEIMVNILEKKGVPVLDKTKQEQRFPVYVRELPGEIVYEK